MGFQYYCFLLCKVQLEARFLMSCLEKLIFFECLRAGVSIPFSEVTGTHCNTLTGGEKSRVLLMPHQIGSNGVNFDTPTILICGPVDRLHLQMTYRFMKLSSFPQLVKRVAKKWFTSGVSAAAAFANELCTVNELSAEPRGLHVSGGTPVRNLPVRVEIEEIWNGITTRRPKSLWRPHPFPPPPTSLVS